MSEDLLTNLEADNLLQSNQLSIESSEPFQNTIGCNKHNHIQRKKMSIIFSSFAALAAGTPYLYGVYSPQLINRCGFSAMDSSYLSFSGNVGSSIGGFLAGLIIDKFGVKAGLLLGASLEFTGFIIFYFNYKYAIHNFISLLFSMCSIGFGSVLAYFATIKVATLNFPKHRGLANALPVSAYGLAALFYACVSTVWYPGDVQGLLKFIAVFAGVVISVSSIFIDIYDEDDEDDDSDHPGHFHSVTDTIDTQNNFNTDFSSDEEETNKISKKNEIEAGIDYLIKGHRGSFAQVNNIGWRNSSSSLFSSISDVPSTSESSIKTSSSSFSLISSRGSTNVGQNPISINPLNSTKTDNLALNNSISSSPLEFRSKHSYNRSGSFRGGSTFNNSPRVSRLFGSATQKYIKDIKMLTNDDDQLISTEHDVILSNNLVQTSASSKSSIVKSNSTEACDSFQNHLSATNLFNYGSIPGTIQVDKVILDNELNQNTSNLIIKAKPRADKKRKKKTLSTREHIRNLFENKLFIAHYFLNAFYCAIGQNYIFGIGFIVRAQVNFELNHQSALFLKIFTHVKKLSKGENFIHMAVAYQALQVSIISFSNFLGRLISGPLSDLIHKRLHMNKLYVVISSLLLLLIGQISLIASDSIDYLSFTSFFIGIAYGAIYGAMPSIVADSFGSKNFATTWSLLGTGPITVFLMLSNYFGYVYDIHSEWKTIDDEKVKLCMEGKYCYGSVFKVTTVTCLVLLVGYVWTLSLRHHR